jgi:hypothetical protein
MPWVHGDWIVDEDAGATPGRWDFEPYVRHVCLQAGWKPLPPPIPVPSGDAYAYAKAILEEFGGLHVGECGQGLWEQARDVAFLHEPESAAVFARSYHRPSRIRDAVKIAEAGEAYVEVFVQADGGFLVVADINEVLYDFGPGLPRFLEVMLRGLEWPPGVLGDF